MLRASSIAAERQAAQSSEACRPTLSSATLAQGTLPKSASKPLHGPVGCKRRRTSKVSRASLPYDSDITTAWAGQRQDEDEEEGEDPLLDQPTPMKPPIRQLDLFYQYKQRYTVFAPRPPSRATVNAADLLREWPQPKSPSSLVEARLPSYTCALSIFLVGCLYLYNMLQRNDTALHPHMWDDFVRFFTTDWWPLWRRYKDTEVYAAEDEDSSLGEGVETPLALYCRIVCVPLYTGRVLTPTTLPALVAQCDRESSTRARESVDQIVAQLGKEGRPKARSRLWVE